MKVACFLLAFCVAFIHKADCAITAWTTPVISGADGHAALTAPLDEDATGDPGITIVATNAASYILVSQSPGALFAVATGGAVTYTGSFDYETAVAYELIIEATEDASNKGTATVTVSIADVNDNTPVFGATSNAVTINDLSVADTVLTTLTATDADATAANNVITYAITATGNTNTDFTVGGATGVITVANALDKSRTTCYDLILTATDSGTTPLTGSTTVNVCVGGSCSCSGAAALVSGAIIMTMTVLVARFL